MYYDQAGKLPLRASVAPATLSYKDTGLTSRDAYTYVVTACSDGNGNSLFDPATHLESATSSKATATAQ